MVWWVARFYKEVAMSKFLSEAELARLERIRSRKPTAAERIFQHALGRNAYEVIVRAGGDVIAELRAMTYRASQGELPLGKT